MTSGRGGGGTREAVQTSREHAQDNTLHYYVALLITLPKNSFGL